MPSPGHLQGDGQVAQFDLPALPKETTVHRAVLRAMPRRGDYKATIEIHPLAADRDQAPAGAKMLALRPPWFNTFDATAAVRACVADGSGAFRVHMKVAPGWRRAQRRTLALVEWAKREFPIDPLHVTLERLVITKGMNRVRLWRSAE